MVVRLAERLGELLRHSHPATEGEPAADAVLALEHRAARSALAGRPSEKANGEEDPATAEQEADQGEPAAHLISEARVEQREGHVVIGLLGYSMPTVDGVGDEAMPVAGLTLTREQTREMLQLLVEQMEQSDWVLPSRFSILRRWQIEEHWLKNP